MNEPANFGDGDIIEGCPVNNLNNPPYVPRKLIKYKSKFGGFRIKIYYFCGF